MSRPHNSGMKNGKALFSSLSAALLSNKILFIVCMIVVIALMIDASLARTSDLLSPTLTRKSTSTLVTFTMISIAYFIGQIMILLFVRNRSKEIYARANMQFYRSYKVTIAVQITLSIILLFVIVQLATVSYYFIIALVATISISYGLAIAMMTLLTKSFLSWFKTSKNFVILAYGISAAILTIHLGFTLFFAVITLADVPPEVRTAVPRIPFFMPGSIGSILYSIQYLTSIVSFIILWAATALLLHHYSQKVGKIKYWIVITLPLVYFLSQFSTLFLNVFDPIVKKDPIFFSSLLIFIFALSKLAGGILFGIAFWTISRSIRRTVAVRDYLMISALGFVLLFTSDQAIVLINVAYPPFGLTAVSFMGLSSYLIFVGIYYSAILISHDDRVRREIKKFAHEESKLLDTIGSAELEKVIVEKVNAITQIHNSVSPDLSVQPSIDQDEIRKYIDDVMHERKASKKKDKNY